MWGNIIRTIGNLFGVRPYTPPAPKQSLPPLVTNYTQPSPVNFQPSYSPTNFSSNYKSLTGQTYVPGTSGGTTSDSGYTRPPASSFARPQTDFGSLLRSINIGQRSLSENPIIKTLGQAPRFGGQFLPGSTLRQTLGNFVDAASKFGFEQIREKMGLNPDLGISEAIAGKGTLNTAGAYWDEPKAPYGQITTGNTLAGQQSQNVLQSKDTSLTEEQLRSKNTLGANDVNDIAGTEERYAAGENDLYGLVNELDQGTNDQWNQLMQQYDQGQIDETQLMSERARIEKEENDRIYAALETRARARIPEYESLYTSGKADLERGLGEYKTEAGISQGKNEQTYGDIIKGITRNLGTSRVNLGNVFSALGTADSSEFMNRSFGLEKNAGEQTAITQRELADKNAKIDRDVASIDADTQSQIGRLLADKNAKVSAVLEQIDINDQEKAARIREINQNLAEDLSALESSVLDSKTQLLLAKQSIEEGRKNLLLEGGLNQDYLEREYELQGQAQKMMPSEVESDLASFLSGPRQSSVAGSQRAAALKSKYPEWADLIDDVYGGRIGSVEELQQRLATL